MMKEDDNIATELLWKLKIEKRHAITQRMQRTEVYRIV